MPPAPRRLLRVSGFVLVAILVALALYPGTLTSPYVTAEDTPKYAHAIVPESSPQYEESVERADPEVYRYEDLSPVARELFDRTRTAEPRPRYNGERRFTPDVCREFMLVCDTYHEDELPEEFTYGTELRSEEAYVFVDDGDDRYLLRTGITGHLFLAPFPVGFVLAWLTMLPLAAFVAAVTVRSTNDRLLAGTVVGGALVATLGFLAPYLELAGLVSTLAVGTLSLTGVWLAILTVGGYRLYRRFAGGERHPAPDHP